MTTETTTEGSVRLLVFRCSELNASIPLKQCITNWTNANTTVVAARGEAKPLSVHQCTRCPIGAEHTETGKFKSGIRTFSLTPAPNAAKPPVSIPKAPTPVVAAPPPPAALPPAPKKEPKPVTKTDTSTEADLVEVVKRLAARDRRRCEQAGGPPRYTDETREALFAVLRADPLASPTRIAKTTGVNISQVLRWGRSAGLIGEQTRYVSAVTTKRAVALKRNAKSVGADIAFVDNASVPKIDLGDQRRTYSFPLRRDVEALLRLPEDFNAADCGRLVAFLEALAWDTTPTATPNE